MNIVAYDGSWFYKKTITEIKEERESIRKKIEEVQKELVDKYGKKGRNMLYCCCPKKTLCQDPKDRHRCVLPNNAPKEYLIAGTCKFCWKITDGLIEVI